MWRNIASNGLTVLIVLLVAAAGFVAWAKARYEAPGPLAQAICLKVEPGSNFRKVSADLAAQGAISESWLFRIGADYSERSGQLKAGSFLVPERASMEEIVGLVTRAGPSTCGTEVVLRVGVTAVDMLVRDLDPQTQRFKVAAQFDPRAAAEVPAEYGDVVAEPDTRYRVVVVEGTQSWQVVEGLKAAGFLAGEVAAVPPEGMLAPDSYDVAKGADRGELLARMQAAQESRLANAWQNREPDLPVSTPEEALILASLIEKETGVAAERPVVASVLENRLKQGIKLQIDSAVEYGVTKGQGLLGRGLRQSELDRDTPYNLYVRAGLPAGPIANPSLAAIEAALHPADTDYLYFVADGSGGHVFAATLAEHNENVRKWRAIEAERAAQPPAGQGGQTGQTEGQGGD